jgi:hypothetical protein
MTCTQTMLCSSAGKLYFVDCKWLNNLTVGPSGFLGFFSFLDSAANEVLCSHVR